MPQGIKEPLGSIGLQAMAQEVASSDPVWNEELDNKFQTIYEFYTEEKIAGIRELVILAEYLDHEFKNKKKQKNPTQTDKIKFLPCPNRTQKLVAALNISMNVVFIACNFLSLVLACALVLVTGSPQWINILNAVSTYVGYWWNNLDFIGASVIGVQQYYYSLFAFGKRENNEKNTLQLQDRELWYAGANFLSGLNMAVLTSLAWMANSGVFYLSAATALGFTGFSFAFCMFVPCLIEVHSCFAAIVRVNALKQKKGKETEINQAYELMIQIEKERSYTHCKQAVSWLLCTIVMTGIATFGYIALSGITFGGLPAATIVVCAAAVLVGLARQHALNATHPKDLGLDFINQTEAGEDDYSKTPCGLFRRFFFKRVFDDDLRPIDASKSKDSTLLVSV